MADAQTDMANVAARDCARVLRFLSGGPARCQPGARPDRILLETNDRGVISLHHESLEMLCRQGVIIRRGDGVVLSEEGRAHVKRAQAPSEPFRQQHWQLGQKTIEIGSGRETVLANLAESPLAGLARRRTRNGEAYLSAGEIRAGERLRSDYTRGQIMPRLGSHWGTAISRGKRTGDAGGAAELTETALAARQRVDRALDAVGPELAGVLVDICCFLKGLEQVEKERGWPVRSAKVILKTALGVLSRHYEPPRRQGKNGKSGRILHWGGEGYRPVLRA